MTAYDKVSDTLQWPPSALAAIEEQRVVIVRLRAALEEIAKGSVGWDAHVAKDALEQ